MKPKYLRICLYAIVAIVPIIAILASLWTGFSMLINAPELNIPYSRSLIIMAARPDSQPDQPLASVIYQNTGLNDKPKKSFFRTSIVGIWLIFFTLSFLAQSLSERPWTSWFKWLAITSGVLLLINYWVYRQTIDEYNLPNQKVRVETKLRPFIVPIKDVTILTDGRVNIRTANMDLTAPFTRIILDDNVTKRNIVPLK